MYDAQSVLNNKTIENRHNSGHMKYNKNHGHSHDHGMFSIDAYAQNSRLSHIHPMQKLIFSIAVLLLCVASNSALIAVITIISMLILMIFIAKLPFDYVFSLMKLPIIFIVISCITIIFNITNEPLGFFDIFIFGKYLSVSIGSLKQAGYLFLKAYGSVTCLYFLSLTTPLQEIIGVLKTLKIPSIIIELMYLIYRYIFVLFDVQNKMTIAASSRLGYSNYKNSWYSFTHISGNLLALSFKRSAACYDAMESRCYQGELNFLSTVPKAEFKYTLAFGMYFAVLFALTILLKIKGVDIF